MKIDFTDDKSKLAAIKAAQFALMGYRGTLKTKLYATDVALNSLGAMQTRINPVKIKQVEVIEKENKDMKHLLAGITVLAAAGAVLGAAGYYVYKNMKKDEPEYEELIFTDDMDDFGEVEAVEEDDAVEKAVAAAADVKDIVAGAAENVADTVSEAFYDIKEAIDSAIEE